MPTSHTLAPSRPEPGTVPAQAAGVELLGEVVDSGYKDAPSLVRRSDGQVLQLTPTLYAILEAIDGQRDCAALAEHLRIEHHLLVEPDDVRHLVEAKLRPLGVLRGADGAEPQVRRSNPLLALRCRFILTNPAVTTRLTAPFARLFTPWVVAAVLAAFALSTAWLLLDQGLASATRAALYEPHLLLVVFALSIASAGFHELGHAAACRRGGATPGAMGVGLYLVWPAFYTDVSDSYRLDRTARLRVDAGGLYFNAVFSVGVVAAWAITGADALLVIVPVQLLQMLRQLLPLVRFDGYHILADLTGVPDLFARIKPTLLGLLPRHWGDPRTRVLKPWARVVVTAWVLVVVPVLAVSVAMMVVVLPRVAATAWDSLGDQWSAMVSHWSEGRLARAAIGAVAVTAIALPIAGMIYLVARIARRALGGLWHVTEGSPPRRVLVGVGLAAGLLLLVQAWWPDGQYEPIRAGERGTLVDGFQALAGTDATAYTTLREASADPGELGEDASATAPGGEPAAAGAEPGVLRSPYRFTPPAPPAGGDNQALALNYEDGSTLVEVSPSLVWVTDGAVRNTNQAYALASCADCTTIAVAFQVVLIVGQNDEIGPQNEAVAVNRECVACRTDALAMQTVLTLPEMPSAEDRAALASIWERVESLAASAPTLGVAEVGDRFEALEAEILALLGGEVAASDRAADNEVSPADPVATATTTTTTTSPVDSSTSTTGGSPTTTTPPSTSSTTTTQPDTTTSTTDSPAATTTTTTTTTAASGP